MRFLLTIIISFFFHLSGIGQFRGLIINEFSQGNTGSREYIELLVVGKRTCNDSTADIRGWIVDDQNGWYGNSNGADGHYRFKDIPEWSAVPFGSIILLYNSASTQKNLSITAADDPTDANKDYNYILPINSNAYLEEHDNEPTNTSGPAYVYPPATSTVGYNGTSNTWVTHIALNNRGGDVLSVISRNKRDSAFFSIGYGYAVNAGYRSTHVSIANVAGGNSAGLIDSNYLVASAWNIAPVPAFETPGSPNGGVNSIWIQEMRTQAKALQTYTTACSSGPYNFLGQTITATGLHQVLTTNNNGCIDTNDVYVVITRNELIDTAGCDSLVYRGITYFNNTTIVDNIKSLIIDCDSLVRTVNIRINRSSSSLTKVCAVAGQSYVFNNQSITASGNYSSTLTNNAGCDSTAWLQIVFKTERADTVRGCGIVVHNGNTYTTPAVVYDTIKSLMIADCDSIIYRTVIDVTSTMTSFITACVNDGDIYNFNGQSIIASGSYSATLQTANNCDSTVNLYIVFKRTDTQNMAGCDSVTMNGTTYYQSTVVSDTIRSLVTGCDSVINTRNITVLKSSVTYTTACTENTSYNFHGQTLTASGLYTHTIVYNANCDSTIQLYLVLTETQTQNRSGCNAVVFNGVTYTSSTIVRDTVRSLVTGCDSLIRNVNIAVFPKPDLQVSDNVTICKGEVVTLTATSSNGTVNWAGFGTTNDITVSPSVTTTYVVVVGNGSSCSDTASVTITVQDFNLNLFASANQVMPGTSITSQTTGNLPYEIIQWEPATLFPIQNLKTQQFIADSSVSLFVVGESSAGCKDTGYLSITIMPLDDIYIPSGFTPNGDGKNELVSVVGPNIKVLDFKIFNRWGQLVFATTEKGKGWDGTLAGKPQATGTYVYVVKARMNSGQVKEKKGLVTLIR